MGLQGQDTRVTATSTPVHFVFLEMSSQQLMFPQLRHWVWDKSSVSHEV